MQRKLSCFFEVLDISEQLSKSDSSVYIATTVKIGLNAARSFVQTRRV